jgi:predicted nucleotidyltransferase
MGIDELLRNKRDDILRIAAEHGASDVRVFGSVARGEADADSDVDLLVALEHGRTYFDLGGLQEELQALFGRRVEVVTEGALSPYLRERILMEAVGL